MKAISLWQPWASLIACGAKRFETRDWAPPKYMVGAEIAIHAAKNKKARDFATELVYGQYGDNGHELADRLHATWSKAKDGVLQPFGECVMPAGCVVCFARLEAAYQLGVTEDGRAKIVRRIASRQEPEVTHVPLDDFGDFSEGRWVWKLGEIKVINPPAPVKGAQGFFDLPQGWLVAA